MNMPTKQLSIVAPSKKLVKGKLQEDVRVSLGGNYHTQIMVYHNIMNMNALVITPPLQHTHTHNRSLALLLVAQIQQSNCVTMVTSQVTGSEGGGWMELSTEYPRTSTPTFGTSWRGYAINTLVMYQYGGTF